MADALYSANEAELTREGVVAIGTRVGVDSVALARCIETPEMRARLDADAELFRRLGLRGLPTTFIGGRSVVGFQPDRLQELLERELAGERFALPIPWLYVVLAFVFGAAATFTRTMTFPGESARPEATTTARS